jgi:hypothetical protein
MSTEHVTAYLTHAVLNIFTHKHEQQIDGIAQGAALVGRAPQWYFNKTTINSSSSSSSSGSHSGSNTFGDAVAYIAGGIWPAARGLSDTVVQLK